MALATKVGAFNSGTAVATTTVPVTGVGFLPKALFLWWSGRTEGTDAVGGASSRMGFGMATSTTARAAYTIYDEDAAPVSVTGTNYNAAACVTVCDGAAETGALDFVSFDSDGFTLVVDVQMPADIRIHYLALGGADLTNATVLEFASDIATGAEAYTGAGFQADAAIFISNNTTAGTPFLANAQLAIGVAVSNTLQATATAGAADASNNMVTASYGIEGPECISPINTSISVVLPRGAFTSFDADGFTLNWLEIAAQNRRMSALLLKGGQYTVGSLLTQTDTTTDIAATGFGFVPVGALFASACRAESTQDTVSDHAHLSVGAFSGTAARGAQVYYSEDALGTSEVATAVEHDGVYVSTDGADAIGGIMDIKSIDGDGFTCIMDDADAAQNFVWYLAFGSEPAAGGSSMLLHMMHNS